MNSLPGNLTRQRNGMEGGSTVPPLTRCVSHLIRTLMRDSFVLKNCHFLAAVEQDCNQTIMFPVTGPRKPSYSLRIEGPTISINLRVDANPQAMLSLHWVDTQCGLNMKKKIAIQSIAFHPSNKSQWLF